MKKTFKRIKKLVVTVTGFTILFVGLLLIFLPGPAFIVIPVGLAILATEFVWAQRLLQKVKDRLKKKE